MEIVGMVAVVASALNVVLYSIHAIWAPPAKWHQWAAVLLAGSATCFALALVAA